jgi:cytosine/adenosine deaminase-related metal-dependent hydrolase
MAKLLKDGTVLSFDEFSGRVKVLPRASILIVNDQIEAITEDAKTLNVPNETEVVDVAGKIISPGFVNTHVHMWQTAYKALGPDIFVVQYFIWLSQMSPAIKAWLPDDIYISALEGYIDGLNAGVTSFIDHAHNNWSRGIMKAGYDAAIDSGARVWWCYDVTPRDNFSVDEQWQEYRKIAAEHGRSKSTVMLGASLDGTGRGSSEVFENSLKMVKELEIKALTTHHIGGPWPGKWS